MSRSGVKRQRRPLSANASAVLFVFVIMLLAAALTGITITVLFFFNLLPDIPYPSLLWPIVTCVVCIALGTGLSALLTRWFLRPVNDLIRAMKAVSHGDFSVRVEERGAKSELVELNKSFNLMAEELGGIEMFRRDFINNFSHEFRTPIISIRGFARQLQNAELSREKQREYTDIIISESDRLTSMSSNILLLTRFENQQIVTGAEDFRLDEQLRAAVLLLEKQWSAKELELEIDLEPVTLRANEEMLSHVWVNLISNAVKFNREGGLLSVSCRKTGDAVAVTVRDSGIGMDEATQKRVFERFYQASGCRSTKGNGLGLAIAKRIVELAGGTIALESEEGAGTAFTVTLPLTGQAKH